MKKGGKDGRGEEKKGKNDMKKEGVWVEEKGGERRGEEEGRRR